MKRRSFIALFGLLAWPLTKASSKRRVWIKTDKPHFSEFVVQCDKTAGAQDVIAEHGIPRFGSEYLCSDATVRRVTVISATQQTDALWEVAVTHKDLVNNNG